MAIYVSGSLAFDRIMTFGGNLQDHVLMDKLHMLSVSFMVDSMDERRGGCAGNIAYTLALLGEKPIVVSAAGRDFTGYAAAWEKLGLSLEGIRRDSDVFTALCYITTDQNNNQITGFYPGASIPPRTGPSSLPAAWTTCAACPASSVKRACGTSLTPASSCPCFRATTSATPSAVPMPA